MSIIITVLVICVSIIVHELGHFCTAKIFNFAIDEFSVGFGPKIKSIKKNGISYSVRILPLGGYVRFSENSKDGKRKFFDPSFRKAIVLIAGVTFNFILAILCLSMIGMISGLGFFEAIYLGVKNVSVVLSQIIINFSSLFGDFNNYGSVVSFGTEVDKILDTAESFKMYIFNALAITFALNISLAIMNLLPIPILDGGQFVINAIELIIKKPISEKIKVAINLICWILLTGFGLFILVRDIVQLF